MTGVCTCKPGSEANGWHEKRCDVCWKAERNAWRDMLAKFRDGDILREIRRKRL